jgi:PKD repeat protein
MEYLCMANNICSNIRVRSVDVPVNDLCVNAIFLPVYGDPNCGGLTTGTLNGVIPNQAGYLTNPCGGNDNADVWYKFIATSSQHKIHVNTTGFDGAIGLYGGSCPQGTGSLLSCENGTCSIGDWETETLCANNLTVGNTYYVRVYTFNGINSNVSCDFTIKISTPYITSATNCQTGQTITNSVNCNSPIISNTLTTNGKIWYKFIATSSQHTINIIPSSLYDPKISFFSGTDQFCNGITLVNTYNINGIGQNESIIVNNLVVGGYYYIFIEHVGNLPPCTSTFELCLSSNVSAPVANFIGTPTTVNVGGNVSFTDQSTGATSWNWSISGSGWSYVGGTNSTSQNPLISFNSVGQYTITLIATNSTGSDSEVKSNYVTVLQQAGPCIPSISNTCDEHIQNVTLNTINNTSGCNSSGYAPYLNTSTTLTKGMQYTVTITPATGNNIGQAYTNDEIAVWIDYNNDFTFSTSERVGYVLVTTGWNNQLTFTIPASAVTGAVRMRVRISYLPDGAISPCGVATYGETEDYTINIVGTAGVNNFEFNEIGLYPNPTESEININLGDMASETSKIEIIDITGKVVYSSSSITDEIIKFDLRHLAKGIYQVMINTQHGKIIKQIIRE